MLGREKKNRIRNRERAQNAGKGKKRTYSEETVALEFVHTKWVFETLHMPK